MEAADTKTMMTAVRYFFKRDFFLLIENLFTHCKDFGFLISDVETDNYPSLQSIRNHKSEIRNVSRHRIISMSSPRMTTHEPFHRQPSSFQRTILLYCLLPILRAGRSVSA